MEKKFKRDKKIVYLCALSNISSGNCGEDCKFCTQSAHHNIDILKYRQKNIDEVVKEAKIAKKHQAVGFCLVTAGKGLNDKKLEYVCRVAFEIKKRVDISLIACNGIATKEHLKELKKSGIEHYNHNLETSKEFYKNICTTHSWDERFETCLQVKKVGLKLCTGRIFGLGESEKDRYSLLKSVKELKVDGVPLNFFIPHEKLPLKECKITKEEALFWIEKFRKELPDAIIMMAGGRERLFGDDWIKGIEKGANSIIIGDYLTIKGENMNKDIEILKKSGYKIEKNCIG